MKKNFSKIFSLVLLVCIAVSLVSCNSAPTAEKYEFKYWNQCASLDSLKSYVETVTDEKSGDFIPVSDRIAVFDMDGTLYGELFPTYLEYLLFAYRALDDKNFVADEESKRVAETIRTSAETGSFPSDMPMQHALGQARVFSGMTVRQFEDYVKEFLKQTPAGFEGMTYATAFYLPMIEVLDYLQKNEFKTYIVSGSDRFICRALASEPCNIPYEQIIGMDVKLEADGQNGKDSLDYQFTANDKVVRTDTVLIKNLKTNKVLQITQEICKQPVLSFGNSSGDSSMHVFSITGNKYKSQAYMLIANDEVRDYGNTEKAEKLGEQWRASGFNVISMKDDWKTIYGDGVTKTASNG
ncbi:MAG: haloacid dehalogenase-like hydrolase [Clostridia bacterium]|nr:haloacid dehalogenase-like hydrolase [Clostridia bacterium]